MLRAILFLLIISFLCPSLFSEQKLISTEITAASINRDINNIFQDSAGFLWILTSDGMARYDGKSFELFNYDPFAAPGATLNDSKFLSCAEDDKGIFWVGTAGGLNKFNPLTFETAAVDAPFEKNSIEQVIYANALFVRARDRIYLKYPEKDFFEQISEDEPVTAMALSPKGEVFFVTRLGKLHSVSVKNDSYELHTVDLSIETYISALCPFVKDGKQFFIAGDTEGFLYRLDEIGNVISKVQSPSAVNNIAQAESSFILACGAGLYLFDTEKDSITPLSDHSNAFNVVYTSHDNIIWAGGWNTGLIRLLPAASGIRRLPHSGGGEDVLHTLFPSFVSGGSLWTAEGNEIIETSFNSQETYRYIINTLPYPDEPTINAFIPLSEDSFLIGTTQGLFGFNNTRKTFNLLLDKPVYSLLYESTGEVWAGSDSSCFRYNPKDGSVDIYPAGGLGNVPCKYLFADSKSRLWASFGEEGFYRLEKGGASFTYYGSDIYNLKLGEIIEDSSGAMWFRTDYSLFTFNEKTDKLELVKLPHPLVWDICNDPQGGILIAGETGAFRYIEGELSPIPGTENIPCVSINRDSSGSIWVGTDGGGLINYVESEMEPVRYTVTDGLQSNKVYRTHEDNRGRIWIVCQKGLSVYYKETRHLIPFAQDASKENGYFVQWGFKELTGNIFQITARDSNLFIDTSQVSASQNTYPLVITKVITGNKNLAPADFKNELELSWEDRQADISFAVLDYTAPEDIIYEYRFSENSNWNSLGRENRIALAGIASGKHTLFVRAYSSRFDSSESRQLSFNIKISPPFWRSPFALIAYILIAAEGCVFAFRSYRQRKENALKAWKIETVEMITHNLKTKLTLLMQLAKGLSNVKTDKDSASVEFEGKLKKIQKQTAVASDELQAIMDSIKFGIDPALCKTVPADICSVVPGFVREFMILAKQKQIEISLDYPRGTQYFVQLEISGFEKMLHNIMDNALSFAKSAIKVSIYAIEENKSPRVYIEFFDDGKPIPKENEKKIFQRGWTSRKSSGYGLGLAFVNEYLQKSGGSIKVKNNNKGKSFIIGFPVCSVEKQPAIHDTLPVLLVVEDDNELRDYLKDTLSSDFSVTAVSSYREALACLKERRPPDIILMDRMLGDYDGIEILKLLKGVFRLSSLPLVFLSGLSETEKRMEALELGAADYITKPFQIEELRIRLKSIIQRDSIVIKTFKDRIMEMELIQKTESANQYLPEYDIRMQCYKENKLSKREIEIAEIMIMTNNFKTIEIAAELKIAVSTVKKHKTKIIEKLNITRSEEIPEALKLYCYQLNSTL